MAAVPPSSLDASAVVHAGGALVGGRFHSPLTVLDAFSQRAPLLAVPASHPIAAMALQSSSQAASLHSATPTASAAAAASLPLSLLRAIHSAVLSSLAEESEVRLRLIAAEQSVCELRVQYEAAVSRAECSDRLRRVRDSEYAASESLLTAAVERERQCEAQVDHWRRQLIAYKVEADDKFREAQQRVTLGQRWQQSAARASKEVRRLSEAVQESERRRRKLEVEVEAEQMARLAAEQRTAIAEQAVKDRQVEAAGRPADDGGRAAAHIDRLNTQLAASEDRASRAETACQQAESDKRELQLKVERMRAYIQQQQAASAHSTHTPSTDSSYSSEQRGHSKRERHDHAERDTRKKQRQ